MPASPPAPSQLPAPPYPRIARAAARLAGCVRHGLQWLRWPAAVCLGVSCVLWTTSPPRAPWSEGLARSYAPALVPMLSREWEALALSGRGVRIGVIDAGFAGWRDDPMLRGLQVEAEVDFTGEAQGDDLSRGTVDHGTRVLRALAGRGGGRVEGLAPDARFLLVLADAPQTETRADEARTIAALRWLAARDVDVINLSLGYIGFEDADGYRAEDLDGRSARITVALNELLAAHPDLVVVVSAGNRGAREWRYIGFPADVAGALTVGAVDPASGLRWRTSSIGPPWLPVVKPDVATWGTRGTSFTAPAVAGLVACLREAAPTLPRSELLGMLRASGSRAAHPDREIGYGVPQTAVLARWLAAGAHADIRAGQKGRAPGVRPAARGAPARQPDAQATAAPAAARPSE